MITTGEAARELAGARAASGARARLSAGFSTVPAPASPNRGDANGHDLESEPTSARIRGIVTGLRRRTGSSLMLWNGKLATRVRVSDVLRCVVVFLAGHPRVAALMIGVVMGDVAFEWPGAAPTTSPPSVWTPAELVLYDARFLPILPGASFAFALQIRPFYVAAAVVNGLFYASVAYLAYALGATWRLWIARTPRQATRGRQRSRPGRLA